LLAEVVLTFQPFDVSRSSRPTTCTHNGQFEPKVLSPLSSTICKLTEYWKQFESIHFLVTAIFVLIVQSTLNRIFPVFRQIISHIYNSFNYHELNWKRQKSLPIVQRMLFYQMF